MHIFLWEKLEEKNKKYSAEFKIGIIIAMREHHLRYSETVRKYWNTTSRAEHDLYRGNLTRWERIYLEEGAEGLMKERRGRENSVGEGKRRGRPPKPNKKVEEDLIAENQRLRMEIEYLKKLDALVRKREREEGKKQK